jgi:predicted ATPase/transcriptional regulator with XRE-family HTH domain
MTDVETSFGKWLKQARREMGFTQKELAHLAACSVTSVRKIEAGVYKPSHQVAQRLLVSLDVPHEAQGQLIGLARSGEAAVIPLIIQVEQPRAASEPRPNNLSAPPTAILGREREIGATCALLLRGDVRLLTLNGPPGIGKTRLALHIGEALLSHFSDGVFFVPLAPVSDPDLVVSAIARSIEVQETGGQTIAQALAKYLREKQMLLLLDNFEQVTAAAPLVASLLSECPRLKILVTSREVLHLRGEHQFQVPPLTVPDPAALPALSELPGYPSIRLFVERAAAVNPNFTLSKQNAGAVAQVCARLDGLPLAIEIAAARTRIFTPQDMAGRLASRLNLLMSNTRDLPARQQTLRKAIDWSYNLLTPSEQTLFARMSIFVGGCTLAGAVAVCDPVGELEMGVLDGVESLVDKSLLQQAENGAGERRFQMLETLREYALERLSEKGETDLVRSWHAQYYLALAEAAEPELVLKNQLVWLDRLENEHTNLRSALDWLLRSSSEGGPEQENMGDRGNRELALRLSAALWRFWFMHGYFSEGRDWLKEALGPGAGTPSDITAAGMSVRAKALHGLGGLAYTQGDLAAALGIFQEALSIWREVGDVQGAAWTLSNMGLVAAGLGHPAEGRSYYEESLVALRQLGEKAPLARALNNLGILVHDQGDYSAAWKIHEESMQIVRELGNTAGIGASATNLGLVSIDLGDLSMAQALFEESLDIAEELGSNYIVAGAYVNLALVAHLREESGKEIELLRKALLLMRELGDKIGIAECLERIGGAIGVLGFPTDGSRLIAAGEALRAVASAPLPKRDRARYARSLAAVQALVSEEAFQQAWSEGRAITCEEAVECALVIGFQ